MIIIIKHQAQAIINKRQWWSHNLKIKYSLDLLNLTPSRTNKFLVLKRVVISRTKFHFSRTNNHKIRVGCLALDKKYYLSSINSTALEQMPIEDQELINLNKVIIMCSHTALLKSALFAKHKVYTLIAWELLHVKQFIVDNIN